MFDHVEYLVPAEKATPLAYDCAEQAEQDVPPPEAPTVLLDLDGALHYRLTGGLVCFLLE